MAFPWPWKPPLLLDDDRVSCFYLNVLLPAQLALFRKRSDDQARGEREAEVRAAYRAVNLDAVRRWSLLCSNYRTIAIFVAALLGSPLYFFLFEIVGLNAAFAGLSAMQARLPMCSRAHA